MRSNIEAHWDEFCDWCEDEGIPSPSMAQKENQEKEEWRIFWLCWEAALDARDAANDPEE